MSKTTQIPDYHSINVTEEEITEHIRVKAIIEIRQEKYLNNISDLFAKVENAEDDHRVAEIVTNALVFSDIRKLTERFDSNTHYHTLHMGLMGYLFGARVWVSRRAQNKTLRVFAADHQADSEELHRDFPEIWEHIQEMERPAVPAEIIDKQVEKQKKKPELDFKNKMKFISDEGVKNDNKTKTTRIRKRS